MQQDHKIASMVSLISSMAEEPISGGATASPVSAPVFRQTQTPPQTLNKCPLIAVSDDDVESSDESSSDSEDYDDNSDYSETSSENDGEEHILSAVDFDDLNVDLETSLGVEEKESDVPELVEEEHLSDAQLSEEPLLEDTTKSIHLDADVTDFTIFKSINISDDHQPEETSYKKMSLTKLREIAQQNGHSDVSKLKKPELLKLLEAE